MNTKIKKLDPGLKKMDEVGLSMEQLQEIDNLTDFGINTVISVLHAAAIITGYASMNPKKQLRKSGV